MGCFPYERPVEERRLVCPNVIYSSSLFMKPVRNDARSVSIISLGCFHPVVKVQSAALHFFLDEENEEESSDEEDVSANLCFT